MKPLKVIAKQKLPKLTDEEINLTRILVRPVVTSVRKALLRDIRSEAARHWKMRGTHRLGRHFERGFFRGLKHAEQIVRFQLAPEKFVARTKKKAQLGARKKATLQGWARRRR